MCRKHAGEVEVPGGPVYRDELVQAGHGIIEEGQDTTYLGLLFVEPRRHARGMGDLDEAEAQRIGSVCARICRALEESEGAERVYVFVLGHGVDHLHLWLLPRYPGTPDDVIGMSMLKWPGARRGGPIEMEALCARVRERL